MEAIQNNQTAKAAAEINYNELSLEELAEQKTQVIGLIREQTKKFEVCAEAAQKLLTMDL